MISGDKRKHMYKGKQQKNSAFFLLTHIHAALLGPALGQTSLHVGPTGRIRRGRRINANSPVQNENPPNPNIGNFTLRCAAHLVVVGVAGAGQQRHRIPPQR